MRAVGEPDRGRGAAHLLHRDAMGEIAHAHAAIFLLDRDPMEAERAHLGPQLHRKAVGLVDLGGNGGDTLVGEIAHAAAQHVDLGAEIVVERRDPGVLHARYMASGPRFREASRGYFAGVKTSVPAPGWSAMVHTPFMLPSGCSS